ncbi:hypothetical protein C7C56_026450 [Massilia glaciei]|uniref:Uncharacterized protein n=1 Tax=Massilia glaciei TaxID=1524097 RepID=A0A2U2HAX8_9BURK|nr:hypothetical protein C7C56_026450 [Massilia glaciei]
MRNLNLPSGTTEGIPLLIDARWTTEQAVAVYELLDDLCEQLWRHYGPQLQQHYSEDRIVDGSARDPGHTGGDTEF